MYKNMYRMANESLKSDSCVEVELESGGGCIK